MTADSETAGLQMLQEPEDRFLVPLFPGKTSAKLVDKLAAGPGTIEQLQDRKLRFAKTKIIERYGIFDRPPRLSLSKHRL
jgi:hypothetical protein